MQEQMNRMENKLDKALENEAKRNIQVEKRLTVNETRLKYLSLGLIALFGLMFDIVKKKLGL